MILINEQTAHNDFDEHTVGQEKYCKRSQVEDRLPFDSMNAIVIVTLDDANDLENF